MAATINSPSIRFCIVQSPLVTHNVVTAMTGSLANLWPVQNRRRDPAFSILPPFKPLSGQVCRAISGTPPVARNCAGTAFDQPGWHECHRLRERSAVDQVDHHAHSQLANQPDLLIDRRERWLARSRFGHIVKADNRQILRHLQSSQPGRFHGAKGRVVIGGKDRRWPIDQPQQPGCRMLPALTREIAAGRSAQDRYSGRARPAPPHSLGAGLTALCR